MGVAPSSTSSAEKDNGGSQGSAADVQELSENSLEKILVPRARKSSGVRCDAEGICEVPEAVSVAEKSPVLTVAQFDSLNPALAKSYLDLPLKFVGAEKVNEYGLFISPSPLYDGTAFTWGLQPVPQSAGAEVTSGVTSGAVPIEIVNGFVSSAEQRFESCSFVPSGGASSGLVSPLINIPGFTGKHGQDELGHWIHLDSVYASLDARNAPPQWYSVEVLSETLLVSGSSAIGLPPSSQGLRFSAWQVSDRSYSLKAHVLLRPLSADGGDREWELEIVTRWSPAAYVEQPYTRKNASALSYSQTWTCVAGAPCAGQGLDAPVYDFTEGLAKGLGRGWVLKDVLDGATWYSAGQATSQQISQACAI